LSIPSERISLFDWVKENYPEVNVLVNNAGIQQRFHVLKADAKDNWDYFNKDDIRSDGMLKSLTYVIRSGNVSFAF
jgi:NAD(P)-dependent dehydrogenase (short-subunit alcohol dehydrogenase family)